MDHTTELHSDGHDYSPVCSQQYIQSIQAAVAAVVQDEVMHHSCR
jgi:hypothetical protein